MTATTAQAPSNSPLIRWRDCGEEHRIAPCDCDCGFDHWLPDDCDCGPVHRDPSRQAALLAHQQKVGRDYGQRRIDRQTFLERASREGVEAWAQRDMIDQTPRRAPRHYESVKRIASHHGRDSGACWRCGDPDAFLERAHIIDRWAGGSDLPSNLSLLCGTCHALQPIFVPGDEEEARAWCLPANPGPSLSPVWDCIQSALGIRLDPSQPRLPTSRAR